MNQPRPLPISVLTIVRGRQQHLLNQRRGWLESAHRPAEWIIVGMDQDVDLPAVDGLPIRTSRIDGDGRHLPLARARNHAAELCQNEHLIFLDVDCIADADMLVRFNRVLEEDPRLWMGSPRYLPAGASDGDWQLDQLAGRAVRHPLQPVLPAGECEASDRYELFWSLCFATTATDFARSGGFDEAFDGYGGEDTDFAFTAKQCGIPFGFVDAVAYHQHHAVCKPPLNHFEAIVRNARRFRQKWDEWPMRSWLDAFAELGLIAFDAERDHLDVLAHPTPDQVEQAKTLTPAGF